MNIYVLSYAFTSLLTFLTFVLVKVKVSTMCLKCPLSTLCCHIQEGLIDKGFVCILCLLIACIWNYVSVLCAFISLVNAFAALMRVNKPKTVSVWLVLTVRSSHLYTYVCEYYHWLIADINRVYIGVGTGSGLFI